MGYSGCSFFFSVQLCQPFTIWPISKHDPFLGTYTLQPRSAFAARICDDPHFCVRTLLRSVAGVVMKPRVGFEWKESASHTDRRTGTLVREWPWHHDNSRCRWVHTTWSHICDRSSGASMCQLIPAALEFFLYNLAVHALASEYCTVVSRSTTFYNDRVY